MKKRILAIALIMAAMTACTKDGKDYDPASVAADTKENNNDDKNEEDSVVNPILDDTGAFDADNDLNNESEENKIPEDELLYNECKEKRELRWLDVSELPGDIDMGLSIYAGFAESSRFDHTDIAYQKSLLMEFIDRGIGLYQFDKQLIDESHFVSTDQEDPRGGYTEYGYYFSKDKKQTDHWFTELYNCAQSDIDKIVDEWNDDDSFHEETRYEYVNNTSIDISVRNLPYSENDKYYFYDIEGWAWAAGVQGREAILEPVREVKEVVYDGVFYYVRYAEYDNGEYMSNNDSTAGLQGTEHDAVLKWKEEDGEQFWSLYYMDMGKFPERQSAGNDVKGIYSDYFYDNFSESDIVYLADVTHDGTEDMIVVHKVDGLVCEGYVYTLSDGKAKEIFSKIGETDHAGGFFNWYIIERDDGWNLADEYFGMWQGMGDLGFSEYYLKDNGDMVDVYSIYCPADDSEVDGEGFVKDDAYDRYTKKLSKLKADYYVLFRSLDDNAKTINTKPAMVFR